MNAHDYAEAHIAFHKLPEELHAEVRLLVIRAYRDGRMDGCDDGTARMMELICEANGSSNENLLYQAEQILDHHTPEL